MVTDLVPASTVSSPTTTADPSCSFPNHFALVQKAIHHNQETARSVSSLSALLKMRSCWRSPALDPSAFPRPTARADVRPLLIVRRARSSGVSRTKIQAHIKDKYGVDVVNDGGRKASFKRALEVSIRAGHPATRPAQAEHALTAGRGWACRLGAQTETSSR